MQTTVWVDNKRHFRLNGLEKLRHVVRSDAIDADCYQAAALASCYATPDRVNRRRKTFTVGQGLAILKIVRHLVSFAIKVIDIFFEQKRYYLVCKGLCLKTIILLSATKCQ